ncbi:hypothetical protein HK101_004972 [Irineochytrium annulatum]|nr:hypothetical protein HK101_004972 [Irineochytrium annulatum]
MNSIQEEYGPALVPYYDRSNRMAACARPSAEQITWNRARLARELEDVIRVALWHNPPRFRASNTMATKPTRSQSGCGGGGDADPRRGRDNADRVGRVGTAVVATPREQTAVGMRRAKWALLSRLFILSAPRPIGGKRKPGFLSHDGHDVDGILRWVVQRACDPPIRKGKSRHSHPGLVMEFVLAGLNDVLDLLDFDTKDALDECVMRGLRRSGFMDERERPVLPQDLMEGVRELERVVGPPFVVFGPVLVLGVKKEPEREEDEAAQWTAGPVINMRRPHDAVAGWDEALGAAPVGPRAVQQLQQLRPPPLPPPLAGPAMRIGGATNTMQDLAHGGWGRGGAMSAVDGRPGNMMAMMPCPGMTAQQDGMPRHGPSVTSPKKKTNHQPG